jgi:hypothetical protein
MKLTKGVTVGNDIFNLGILRVDSRIGIYNQWDRE